MNDRLVRNVSDTALWAALHRAKETERGDGQFQDPFARRLAGERGEQIAAALAFSEADSWSWMARTYLFDEFITAQVRDGADIIVNLGAGLDTRPYRMNLPASLIWIEVDLPDILAYKQEILASEHPHCHLELVPLDLADVFARRSMFNTLSDRATKGVVLTEGLLIYLASDAAGILARDLAAAPALQHWIVDIVSPGLLRMLRERTNEKFSETASPLQFGPENGPRFFEAHGWKVEDVQSLVKTAGRLNRLPEAMSQLALLPEDPSCMGTQPWGGVCLLEQVRLRSED